MKKMEIIRAVLQHDAHTSAWKVGWILAPTQPSAPSTLVQPGQKDSFQQGSAAFP